MIDTILQEISNISIVTMAVSLATKKSNPTGITLVLNFVPFLINWVRFIQKTNICIAAMAVSLTMDFKIRNWFMSQGLQVGHEWIDFKIFSLQVLRNANLKISAYEMPKCSSKYTLWLSSLKSNFDVNLKIACSIYVIFMLMNQ